MIKSYDKFVEFMSGLYCKNHNIKHGITREANKDNDGI